MPKNDDLNIWEILFQREPSTPVDGYRFRFHWGLLLLPLVAAGLAVAMKPLAEPVQPPTEKFCQLGFVINTWFRDSMVVVAVAVFILGVGLYQQGVHVVVAVVLALFPFMNRQMLSMMMVPSFACYFAVSVSGMCLAMASLHFRVTSYLWLVLCVLASALFGVALYIRPEAVALEAVLQFGLLGQIVQAAIKGFNGGFAFVVKFLSMNTQVFTIGFPFVAVGILLGDIAGAEISYVMSEPRLFVKAFADDMFGYGLLIASLMVLWKMERSFLALVCVFACVVSCVLVIVVPMEGIDSPVAGKLLTLKLIMLFLAATVFGRMRSGRLAVVIPVVAAVSSCLCYLPQGVTSVSHDL